MGVEGVSVAVCHAPTVSRYLDMMLSDVSEVLVEVIYIHVRVAHEATVTHGRLAASARRPIR